MSQRVNIKADESTRDRLRQLKRHGETWDGLLLRAADALEAEEDREQHSGAPRCTECGAIAHGWTIQDGCLICGSCTDWGEDDIEIPE